jgi:hypothetical protein
MRQKNIALSLMVSHFPAIGSGGVPPVPPTILRSGWLTVQLGPCHHGCMCSHPHSTQCYHTVGSRRAVPVLQQGGYELGQGCHW